MWLRMFCRLFVVASAPTLYMHMLDLSLCLIFLTGNDATAWRCHVFNRHVLRWVFFFHSTFTAAHLFSVLFLTHFLTIPRSRLLSTSAHTPSEMWGKVFAFFFWIFSPTLWPSLLLPFLFAFLYVPPASICLAWSPPQLAPCQSPLEESCSEDMSLNSNKTVMRAWQRAIRQWPQLCWWLTAKLPLQLTPFGRLAVSLEVFLLTAKVKLDHFCSASQRVFDVYTTAVIHFNVIDRVV